MWGVFFTISERARRDGLARLPRLNLEYYEGAVKVGLHGRKGKGGKTKNLENEDGRNQSKRKDKDAGQFEMF